MTAAAVLFRDPDGGIAGTGAPEWINVASQRGLTPQHARTDRGCARWLLVRRAAMPAEPRRAAATIRPDGSGRTRRDRWLVACVAAAGAASAAAFGDATLGAPPRRIELPDPTVIGPRRGREFTDDASLAPAAVCTSDARARGTIQVVAARAAVERPPPCGEAVVRVDVGLRTSEGRRVRPESGRVRVEFLAAGRRHVHEPFVRAGVVETTVPAVCVAMPADTVSWRAVALETEGDRYELDDDFASIASTKAKSLDGMMPQPTFVRVVAAESGRPLDAGLDRVWAYRCRMIPDVPLPCWSCAAPRQAGELVAEHARACAGREWLVVQGSSKSGESDVLEVRVCARGRIDRTVRLDRIGGGEREVRLWPSTTLDVRFEGVPEGPRVWTTLHLEAVHPTLQWRKRVEIAADGGRIEGLPPCALRVRASPRPFPWNALGEVDAGSAPARAVVIDGTGPRWRKQEFPGWTCGGNRTELDCDAPLAMTRVELRDGVTRVPSSDVIATGLTHDDGAAAADGSDDPRARDFTIDRSRLDASVSFTRPGRWRLEIAPLDGFWPIAPVELDVPGRNDGGVTRLPPIVIKLRREGS